MNGLAFSWCKMFIFILYLVVSFYDYYEGMVHVCRYRYKLQNIFSKVLVENLLQYSDASFIFPKKCPHITLFSVFLYWQRQYNGSGISLLSVYLPLVFCMVTSAVVPFTIANFVVYLMNRQQKFSLADLMPYLCNLNFIFCDLGQLAFYACTFRNDSV